MTTIRNLSTDFYQTSKFNDIVDESNRDTKIYIEKATNTMWFVKPSYEMYSDISQLIVSKLYRHFLGENAAETVLAKDDTGRIYIASRQIENFKTLNQVGSLCDNTPIELIEKLNAVKTLVQDFNDEPKNLGVIIKDNHCIAAKVDVDEGFQGALLTAKNNLFKFEDMTNERHGTYTFNQGIYTSKTFGDKVDSQTLLQEMQKIISTDCKTLKDIINSAIDEVQNYYTLANLQQACDSQVYDITSFAEIGDLYFKYLMKNMEAMKALTQFREQKHMEQLPKFIEQKEVLKKCYEVAKQEGYEEWDFFSPLQQLHDIFKLDNELAPISQKDKDFCIKEFTEWGPLVSQLDVQAKASLALSEYNLNYNFAAGLQFTNYKQISMFEMFSKHATFIPKLMTVNSALFGSRPSAFAMYQLDYNLKFALLFDQNGQYQGKDPYAKDFFTTCHPLQNNEKCLDSFNAKKLSGIDEPFILPFKSLLDQDGKYQGEYSDPNYSMESCYTLQGNDAYYASFE